MSEFEIFLVLVLAGLIAYPMVKGYRSRSPLELWSPLLVFSAVYMYYFLIGPLSARALGLTRVINVDASSNYYLGWLAGIAGLGSVILGFRTPIERSIGVGPRLIAPNPKTISTIGWCCLFLGAFGMISWVIGGTEGVGGAFSNYVFRLTDLLLVYYATMIWRYRTRPIMALLWVGIPFALADIGFMQIGFRGPIVMHAIAVVFLWYIVRDERPRIWTVLAGGFGIIVFSGLMVLTRTYFSGLNLEALSGRSFADVLYGGVSDSITFGALSMVIARVPSMFGFAHFEFLLVAITFPIPRALWPDKPYPEYLTTIQYCVDANLDTDGSGMAVPHIGEYYLAFGWPGIIVCCFIFGLFCRWMWRWFLQSRDNPLVLVTYAAFCGWLFQVTHRCHLAGAFSGFCLMIVPCFIIARRFSRRAGPQRAERMRNGSMLQGPGQQRPKQPGRD